jgi:DNA-binding NtrC family response regulator
LENVVERSILLAPQLRLEAGDIRIDTGQRTRPTSDGVPFLPEGMTLDQYEQEILKEAIKRANGNKSQAARLLGLTRNALRYRLSQMGLE